MRWSVVLLKDKRVACNTLDRWQHLLRVKHRGNTGHWLSFQGRQRSTQSYPFLIQQWKPYVYLQFEGKLMIFRILKFPKVRKVRTINRWGGIFNHLSTAYLLSNISTKSYWNRTTIFEIILGGWAVSFFETQCSSARPIQTSEMTVRFSVVRQRGFLRTTGPTLLVSWLSIMKLCTNCSLRVSSSLCARTATTRAVQNEPYRPHHTVTQQFSLKTQQR